MTEANMDILTYLAMDIASLGCNRAEIIMLTGTIIKAWCIEHNEDVHKFIEDFVAAIDYAEKNDRELYGGR